MALTQITAKKEIEGVEKSAAIGYDFGENCDDAIAKFGADVVFTNFKGSAKITAQAAMRRCLEQKMDVEAIQAKMALWKPGVAMDRSVDPAQALMAQFGSKTPEEQLAIIEGLKKKAAEGKKAGLK